MHSRALLGDSLEALVNLGGWYVQVLLQASSRLECLDENQCELGHSFFHARKSNAHASRHKTPQFGSCPHLHRMSHVFQHRIHEILRSVERRQQPPWAGVFIGHDV